LSSALKAQKILTVWRVAMAKISNDSRDKLQAVIIHWKGASDDGSLPGYSADCQEWYAKLSDTQKALTQAAMIIYEMGDKLEAAQIVANLPPAPKRPDRYMTSEGGFV
jgi:hypothetical protein